uniref:Thioesterase superfamily protein n=1 Tax=Cyanothece sp. (strain PCC 7425 / ATCC 29141) TaxID=395961 RepID=B8HWG5_CYAP4
MQQPWFNYRIRVHPHHTDYAGVVWHGTYLAWMEEARVECLRSVGIDFATLVAMDCDLPVVGLELRYLRGVSMGTEVVVRSRLAEIKGIRIYFQQQIEAVATSELLVRARVELVPLNRSLNRVLRKLPPPLQTAIEHLSQSSAI